MSEPMQPTPVRYLVIAWLCSAATLSYVQRNSIAIAESTIRADLNLTEQEMGWVLSAFFAAYALFQLPGGYLCHILGTRRSLTVLTLVWSAATGLTGLASGVMGLIAARLGMGAAQAGIFPACTSSIGRWIPLSQRALASGALGSFMSVGGALGAMATGFLLAYLNWRWLFLLYALPGLVWAAWFYAWFRDSPRQHTSVNEEELRLIEGGLPRVAGIPGGPTPWRKLLTSPAMGWICGQQFFRAAGYSFFASWFATFLQETRGVSLEASGLLTSLPLWGVVFGSLAGGWLSDQVQMRTGSRRHSRKAVAAVSMLACAIFTLSAYPVESPWLAVLLITLGSLFASAAGACAYVITIDMGGHHVAPVFSTMNMCGNIGAMLFPLAVPWIVETSGSWHTILFVYACIYVAAAICWMLLNPDGTILDDAQESSG